MKRLSPEEELAAVRNLEPDDCDIAAVGGARRCSSCGRPGGGHEIDCQRARRLEREKLQAECNHRSETVTRTTGDPPGPPCCGRCGLELSKLREPRESAREPLIVQVPTLLSLVNDQLTQYPERDLVFATPVEGQAGNWIVDLICGHRKAVHERKASYVCRECPKEIT
jgi:hypothetical protein